MTNKDFRAERKGFCLCFKEMMDKFNKARTKWIEEYGNDFGFAEWFTQQTTGEKLTKGGDHEN